MLFNTIVEPEGAEAGGHRHALFCIPYFAEKYQTVVVAPEFTRRHIRAQYLAGLNGVDLRGTVAGNFLRAQRATALMLRSLTNVLVPAADVYYASSGFLPDTIGPSLRRLFRPSIRFAVVIHHLVDMEQRKALGEGNFLAAAFEKISLWFVRKFATTVIAGNAIVRDQLCARGIDPSRIVVTTNGVQHRSATGDASSRRREALFIGRISLRKGVADLCRAWARVNDGTGWRLTLVGAMEPRDAAVLEPLIESTADVEYAGRLSEDELVQALNRAAIFVMPSYEEGWCIAIAEAMACALPVVSYDLPIFDLSFDRGRIAVRIGDEQALAEALKRLMTDDAARAQLARDAWERAKQFDWANAARIELDGMDAVRQ